MIYARCKKHLCSLQICFFEVREKRFVHKSLRHVSFPVAYLKNLYLILIILTKKLCAHMMTPHN